MSNIRTFLDESLHEYELGNIIEPVRDGCDSSQFMQDMLECAQQSIHQEGERFFVTTQDTLPRWDMTSIYPGLESPEFTQGFTNLTENIQELVRQFDTYQIMKQSDLTLTDETVQIFETVLKHYNAVMEETRTISSYVNCFVTTDSRDSIAQARLSELQQYLVPLSNLGTRFIAWLGSLDADTLIARSDLARKHSYALQKAKQQAAHLMSPEEEELATTLNVSSGVAWSRLHGNVTSQISIELEGETREYPMSMIRNMAFDANRDLRRRAYEAELAGWQRTALPLAAALNSIKQEVNVLAGRRKWGSPLDAALFANNIDRQTLDAMLSAAHASFPDFRRYLHAKARILGIERLAWYDLFAPISSNEKTWTFDEAREFIIKQFGTYSTRLADFAYRAFNEQWIDAEPRSGKRDGAYCTSIRGDESRIFANFKPAFGGLITLAHELGHGYHNVNLSLRTALQRANPMTLAETASTFCETIVRQAALQKADQQEQLAILEASLEASCQVVVDISSRFLFEERVFEKRRQRELSIDEINNTMLEAQRETYGDGLDENVLHPYMWAVKTHYYNTARSFYNFPYMFGLLFGLGLYARYQQDADTFKRGYDELLSLTGMDDAATLAARFGIDIRSEAFWQSSLDIIRKDVDRFEKLANI